jgi:hypothetical protein
MNCFDLFFIGLFKSYKQSHEFIGRLTKLNQVIFFIFFLLGYPDFMTHIMGLAY